MSLLPAMADIEPMDGVARLARCRDRCRIDLAAGDRSGDVAYRAAVLAHVLEDRRVSNPAIRRPRLVVVDEAWLLMKERYGARFLLRMAKSSRKHWAGLTVV